MIELKELLKDGITPAIIALAGAIVSILRSKKKFSLRYFITRICTCIFVVYMAHFFLKQYDIDNNVLVGVYGILGLTSDDVLELVKEKFLTKVKGKKL